MEKTIDKVHIKRPPGLSDKELKVIFQKLKVRAKINSAILDIHVTTLNDNGIFNLGMKFQEQVEIYNTKKLIRFLSEKIEGGKINAAGI